MISAIYESRNILKLFIFPFMVFVVNYAFVFLGVYDLLNNLGMMMHFLGGISAGYSFFLVLSYFESEYSLKLNRFFTILFVTSLVAFIAVLWEFYEFAVDYFFGTNWQASLGDTMLDLLLGIVGGLFIVLFLIFKK
ncbi:MAG: hypothetical protein AABX28_01655 [Nanoarchaeota archaeon]